jgi:hypothetical protein
VVVKFSAFYKNNENDKIWWADQIGIKGGFFFSFDKKKIFSLFKDYPQNLTKEQKELFDLENPEWARYFAGEDEDEEDEE